MLTQRMVSLCVFVLMLALSLPESSQAQGQTRPAQRTQAGSARTGTPRTGTTRAPQSPSRAGTARVGTGSRTPARNTSAATTRTRPTSRPTETRLTPEVEKLLVDWSNSSGQIKRLQGQHRRRVYDHVFHVEKRSQGEFFYEAKDKGRIDISSTKIPKGEVSRKIDEKKRAYKLQADKPEKWICDGTRIFSINETDKEAEVFEIPERARGENIMNGPLPFLFGMPPEVAKKRYAITMASNANPKYHQLKIKPRWQQDAANWKEANILLDRNSFLPIHVQLIHPTGNTETVYSFGNMKINAKPYGIFGALSGRDPFKPSLRGYKVNTLNEETLAQKSKEFEQRRRELQNIAKAPKPANRQSVIPDVRGYAHSDAKKRLESLGLKVKFFQGPPAKSAADKYKVVSQKPDPLANLPASKVVHLTLYTAPKTAARSASNTRVK